MISLLSRHRCAPVALDLGTHSVKMLQLSGDASRVVAAALVNMRSGWAGPELDDQEKRRRVAETLADAGFRGREVVLALNGRDLVVQNIRVAGAGPISAQLVHQELAGRLPFVLDQAEVRFLRAGQVAHPEGTKQELIVLASPKERIQQRIEFAESLGLVPVGLAAEPLALLRCASRGFRRKEDQQQGFLLVHVGARSSLVIVAQGVSPRVIKYLPWGGNALDELVAEKLGLALAEAASLRRYHGERRADRRDPELQRRIQQALEPMYEKLATELSLCIRYYSITYRCQNVRRIVLGGGEAQEPLAQFLQQRLQLPCRLIDPLPGLSHPVVSLHPEQWDLAAGLALHPLQR